MRNFFAATLAFAFALAPAPAARAGVPAPSVTLENTELRQIPSTLAGRTYQLSVLLPYGYATSDKRYPVLYVLDGVWNFAFLHGLSDTLTYAKRLPETIIVGIDYGLPYAGIMEARAHDFTPNTWRAGGGGAAVFLQFLETELIPHIDATYRTDPRDRGLIGHSYGGLFGVYAWLERPKLFQRIVAASPSIYWDDDLLVKAAEARLPAEAFPARLDVSIGADEDAENVAAVKKFARLLTDHPPKDGAARVTFFPDENHNSAKPLAFIRGLPWVYRDE